MKSCNDGLIGFEFSSALAKSARDLTDNVPKALLRQKLLEILRPLKQKVHQLATLLIQSRFVVQSTFFRLRTDFTFGEVVFVMHSVG